VTIERGTEEQVRSETREAINVLGPTGLILSPVDNITIDAPLTWANIDFFKEEWKSYSDKTTLSQEVKKDE
jgi:hypothetical protein